MHSNVTHILPQAIISRSRMLPIPGTVLVRAGQEVEATDVIAEVNLYPEHILLDIAKGLAVSPETVGKYIQREIGEEVAQDGIIAERNGSGRVVRAPKTGKVVTVSGGKTLLQTSNESFQLLAGYSGVVTEINADYGAVIETAGAFIQGLWGNDRISSGILAVFADDASHKLSMEEINTLQKGAIVFAGHCGNPSLLEAGNSNEWAGLILGSMPSSLIPTAKKMPYPIIIIEGFGHIELNETAFKLISTSVGRNVSLNAIPFDPIEGHRPEITIPLPKTDIAPIPLDMQLLEPGTTVRVLRSPYQGKVAKIKKLLPGKTRFPSGIQTAGVEIKLSNEEKVLVPVANIEVLG